MFHALLITCIHPTVSDKIRQKDHQEWSFSHDITCISVKCCSRLATHLVNQRMGWGWFVPLLIFLRCGSTSIWLLCKWDVKLHNKQILIKPKGQWLCLVTQSDTCPAGIQEVTGSILYSGTILSLRLIMKYFLQAVGLFIRLTLLEIREVVLHQSSVNLHHLLCWQPVLWIVCV